jgi:tetratricopeptide (TPR) repeat protein
MVESAKGGNGVSPLAYYYLGEFAERLGENAKAGEYRRRAKELSPDYAFPFQSELLPVLQHAMQADPSDPKALYYLGNLLFDWQPTEAVKLWERSAALDPSFPIVHRNLAVAYSHEKPTNDLVRAVAQLELAVASSKKYALHFAELDELYARVGALPKKRLALLEQNQAVVSQRDDSLSREIGLLVFAGKYDDAIRLMTGRKFSVWEGGSLDVADHWVNAHLLRGRRKLAAHHFSAALEDFSSARTIPQNLPTERELGRTAELCYWEGTASEANGDKEAAQRWWRQAVEPATSEGRRQRRDGLADRQVQVYYQALARRKLGQNEEAETALRDLAKTAQQVLDRDGGSGDSGERRQTAQTALACYLAGLGHLGLGDTSHARVDFEQALQAQPDLLGPKAELTALSNAP